MRFIAANTSIPVPQVYEQGSKPVPSITMDYIEGDRLDKIINSAFDSRLQRSRLPVNLEDDGVAARNAEIGGYSIRARRGGQTTEFDYE